MPLRDLLDQSSKDVALLIGNGINLYDAPSGGSSWDALLDQLAKAVLGLPPASIPPGISLTEFYDVLELRAPSTERLQAKFCDLMTKWEPRDQHRRIAAWAERHAVPVLTTNFEATLGKAAKCELNRMTGDGFTAFYPWGTYFGPENLMDPCASFAVWHVNGMQRYRQSVRLGLTHYMGSVGRARSWLHHGPKRLMEVNNARVWFGARTWLQVFFHKPLLIFGLKLAENEIFLRWLLLERARYFRKFPARKRKAWYVHAGVEGDLGKVMFLNAVGVECFQAVNYDELYGALTWGPVLPI